MSIQELFDVQIFGVTIRNIARVIVFGGIIIILLRKLVRRLKGKPDQMGKK